MEKRIGVLALTGLVLGVLGAARAASPLAIASREEALAATQGSVTAELLRLKAKASTGEPKGLAPRVAQLQSRYDALIAASRREEADLLRYAQWHRLEALGPKADIARRIAAQRAIIARNRAAEAANPAARTDAKVVAAPAQVRALAAERAAISKASRKLANLEGYLEWKRLAAAGAGAEAAKLIADQRAVIAMHTAMKASYRAASGNQKAGDLRYQAMDRHCDSLIRRASRRIEVLRGFLAK